MNVKVILKFPDTKEVLGYDSEGNRKRGRPRGREQVLSVNAGKICWLPVSVVGNQQLENILNKDELLWFRLWVIGSV